MASSRVAIVILGLLLVGTFLVFQWNPQNEGYSEAIQSAAMRFKNRRSVEKSRSIAMVDSTTDEENGSSPVSNENSNDLSEKESSFCPPRKPKLVYIDCGANAADTFRVFVHDKDAKFEYNYPKPDAASYYDFEVHLIEANPIFTPYLEEAREQYSQEPYNMNINIYPQTLCAHNDHPATFYLDKVKTKTHFGPSSTVVESIAKRRNLTAISLRGMDMADFLNSNFIPEDFVVFKMDIEGAEFNVIPHLVAQSSHRLIDYLMLESHEHLIKDDPKYQAKVSHVEIALKLMRDGGVQIPHYKSPL